MSKYKRLLSLDFWITGLSNSIRVLEIGLLALADVIVKLLDSISDLIDILIQGYLRAYENRKNMEYMKNYELED